MSFRQPKGSTIGIIKTGATVQQKFDSLDQSIIDLTNIVNQINKGGGGENVGTPWLYSATGGETSFTITSSATIASISCIFINGTRQEPTINFTYDAATKKISLVGFSLVAGDQVVVIILDGTSPTLTKLAAQSGASLVGTTNNKTVQQNFNDLFSANGAKLIGTKRGGFVQDALISVYVDSFGADPTGQRSSTAAVNAALASINTVTNSLMNGDVGTTYAELIFGNGRYIVGDITLKSGVVYRGQGAFATTLMPESTATWVFKTVGTLPYETNGSSSRLFRTVIRDMHIGCGLQNVFTDYSIPSGVGAIYIAHASYVTIEDVYIRHMDGPGIRFESLWDSDTINVRIMYVGNTRDVNNPAWAWYVGAGTAATDGSNANRFLNTHIEGCPANVCVDLRSRHNFFLGGKIESVRSNDPTKYSSSLIKGVDGLVFANMEFSWSNIGKFMFEGVGTTTLIDTSADDVSDPNCDHSRGVVFLNPIIIDSNALSGDYFKYKSDRGVLRIAGGYARHCRYLLSGSDIRLSHFEMVQCGPTIGILQGNVIFDTVDVSRSRVLSSGSFSGFTITGVENYIRNSKFGTPYGSPSDGNSWFTINSTTGVEFQNIVFSGQLQYGISGSNSNQQRKFLNIKTASGATYGSLINGGYSFTGLPTRVITDTGYAVTHKVTVPVDTSLPISDIIGGGCDLIVRVENASGVPIAVGKFLCDAGISAIIKIADLAGNIGVSSSGASGDGKIYFSSSTATLTVVNRTTSAITIYLMALNAK